MKKERTEDIMPFEEPEGIVYWEDERERLIAKLSSEERIQILMKWETEGLDNDVLVVEIGSRTGFTWREINAVLEYKYMYLMEMNHTIIYWDELAEEIGNIKTVPDTMEYDLEGIEDVDAETAYAILECEDEIFWEIGLAREK